MENTNATAADAELVLRLYELRREPVMRQARDWLAMEFWPRTFADLERIRNNFGGQDNAFFRQIFTYWDMACAMVVRGALHPGLFYDTGGEAWFAYVKIRPFLQEARTKWDAPEFLMNLERVLEGTPEGRERLRHMQENMARWAAMREEELKKGKAGKAA